VYGWARAHGRRNGCIAAIIGDRRDGEASERRAKMATSFGEKGARATFPSLCQVEPVA
jgi:hypothetical protein